MRKYHDLPSAIEDQIWNLKDQVSELLTDDFVEAEVKAKQAWDLIPEPKFKWGIAHTTLYDYVEVLNINTRHAEAFELLDLCIKDLEATGDKVIDGDAYIRMGETLLHLDRIEDSKKYFELAYKIGKERAFTDTPKLYLEIAKAKKLDIEALKDAFDEMKKTEKEANSNDSAIDPQIEELIEKGNEFADEEDYKNAISVWEEALSLVPEPKGERDETSWLYASIGDGYYQLENYARAKESFFNAKSCIVGDAYDNPFVMLRLGQSCFECKNFEEAAEYLIRAYALEGKAIFKGEDKKYLEFLKTRAKI